MLLMKVEGLSTLMMSPMVQSVSAIVRTAMHRYMLKMADIKESIILRMHMVKNAKEPTSQFYTYWPKKSSRKQAE